MNYNNHNKQVEPTQYRAQPWLDGVNIQRMRYKGAAAGKGKGQGKGSKGEPGALSTWWGTTWIPAGKGRSGKGHHAGGDQWGQASRLINRAPSVAPAVASGQSARPWADCRSYKW